MLQRRLWLMLILLAAFAFRVHTLGAKSLWYDELRQIEVASHPLADFPSKLANHSARPLDYWLTHYLLRAGPQAFWLRFPALLWGTLSVALMFPLARRWFDGRTALIAIALMAAAPIGVQYSHTPASPGLRWKLKLRNSSSLRPACADPLPLSGEGLGVFRTCSAQIIENCIY